MYQLVCLFKKKKTRKSSRCVRNPARSWPTTSKMHVMCRDERSRSFSTQFIKRKKTTCVGYLSSLLDINSQLTAALSPPDLSPLHHLRLRLVASYCSFAADSLPKVPLLFALENPSGASFRSESGLFLSQRELCVQTAHSSSRLSAIPRRRTLIPLYSD